MIGADRRSLPSTFNINQGIKLKLKTNILAVSILSVGITVFAPGSQAGEIQSMTIEDTSSSGSLSYFQGGAYKDFTPGLNTGNYTLFNSVGSTDGAILMGVTQGNGAFVANDANDANDAPYLIHFNTLNGAPSGSITNNVMTLNLSGWGGNSYDCCGNLVTYDFSPDPGTLSTSVIKIDETHYYYTADWSHLISSAPYWYDNYVFHLEGIATVAAVPEADTYAMMLAGLGLVGFMAKRRRP